MFAKILFFILFSMSTNAAFAQLQAGLLYCKLNYLYIGKPTCQISNPKYYYFDHNNKDGSGAVTEYKVMAVGTSSGRCLIQPQSSDYKAYNRQGGCICEGKHAFYKEYTQHKCY